MIIDFRINKAPVQSLKIKNEEVEQVDSYKYLGITIDKQLDWRKHSEQVSAKANKRMYFLRKLISFNVDRTIMSLFYHSSIESVFSFCITCWARNVREKDKAKLNAMIKKASKITNANFLNINGIFELNCVRKLKQILTDPCHPLFSQIKLSVRSNRPLHMKCNKERYKRSFLPTSIRLLSVTN